MAAAARAARAQRGAAWPVARTWAVVLCSQAGLPAHSVIRRDTRACLRHHQPSAARVLLHCQAPCPTCALPRHHHRVHPCPAKGPAGGPPPSTAAHRLPSPEPGAPPPAPPAGAAPASSACAARPPPRRPRPPRHPGTRRPSLAAADTPNKVDKARLVSTSLLTACGRLPGREEQRAPASRHGGRGIAIARRARTCTAGCCLPAARGALAGRDAAAAPAPAPPPARTGPAAACAARGCDRGRAAGAERRCPAHVRRQCH